MTVSIRALGFRAAVTADQYTVTPDIEFTRPAETSVKMDAHVPPGRARSRQ
ncbi:MAG: hypothetical protein M3Z36_08140 [Acidobacteriota bacterium]|nr:hypothetical protein [Acidobacteriota bacterium]